MSETSTKRPAAAAMSAGEPHVKTTQEFTFTRVEGCWPGVIPTRFNGDRRMRPEIVTVGLTHYGGELKPSTSVTIHGARILKNGSLGSPVSRTYWRYDRDSKLLAFAADCEAAALEAFAANET